MLMACFLDHFPPGVLGRVERICCSLLVSPHWCIKYWRNNIKYLIFGVNLTAIFSALLGTLLGSIAVLAILCVRAFSAIWL